MVSLINATISNGKFSVTKLRFSSAAQINRIAVSKSFNSENSNNQGIIKLSYFFMLLLIIKINKCIRAFAPFDVNNKQIKHYFYVLIIKTDDKSRKHVSSLVRKF